MAEDLLMRSCEFVWGWHLFCHAVSPLSGDDAFRRCLGGKPSSEYTISVFIRLKDELVRCWYFEMYMVSAIIRPYSELER